MTTNPPATVLTLDGVSLAFGGLKALSNVGFSVYPGQVLGLIGPNGAGKTTCLRVIGGLLTPDKGSVALEGRALVNLPIHRRVGRGLVLTNQIVRPLRALTVLDNVALAWGRRRVGGLLAALLHTSRTAAQEAAQQLLNKVGIEEYAHHLATDIPLGVLKRLEVARALALEPRVVLFDEPLAGLNHIEAQKLAELIASLTADGLAVVLVEHNLREVVRVCERLVVLESGRVLADGQTAQVIKNPAVIKAYIGDEGIDA